VGKKTINLPRSCACEFILNDPKVKLLPVESMEFVLSNESMGGSALSFFTGLSQTSFVILLVAVLEVPEEHTLLLELPL
jgi:hypothetical protein